MAHFKKYFCLVFGCLISGAGIGLFLSPAKIAAGGASGVGILLYNLFSVPVSVTVILINIVLLIIGYKYLDKTAIIKTVLSTALLSVFIEIFSVIEIGINDRLISCVYGGALAGVGTGLVINSGASTGGTDLCAVLLHKAFPFMTVPKLILIVDLAVASFSGTALGEMSLMLYAIAALFVASKGAEFIIEGINFSTLIFIISDEHEEISHHIINGMKRGVTSFEAKGEFSKKGKRVLMCALSPTEFPKLKSYIYSKDKNAFIILADARSVYGEGFNME